MPWQFAEPSLVDPGSQLCTVEQMQGEHYAGLCSRLGIDSVSPHRKMWEFAYILFDFCWSACCLEHLRSISNDLQFLRRCLETLRPGGISVHTTEFNLGSDTATVETPSLALFRRCDIEQVIVELVAEGHMVEPLNLWPGTTAVDEHVDLPPYSLPHLKLEIGGHQVTSFGLVVTKAS